MIRQNQIVNFDAFADFAKILVGDKFEFALREDTLRRIRNKKKYRAMTIKSSSLVTEKVLKAFPGLELLVTRTVGTNHVDMGACRELEIVVKNIPDYGAFSIAEHVFALLLTMTRKVIFLDREVREGRFSSEGGRGYTLEGKTMGVLGLGRIGKEIVKLSKAFRMNVVGYDLYPNDKLEKDMGFLFLSLEEVLTKSDVVSINVPLTKETRHLIGKKELKMMKRGSVLINTSRGAVIDTDELVNQIDKFEYVGLDVVEDEGEFGADHPLLNYKNVVITPHCAYFTDRSARMIARKTRKLVSDFFGGIE